MLIENFIIKLYLKKQNKTLKVSVSPLFIDNLLYILELVFLTL